MARQLSFHIAPPAHHRLHTLAIGVAVETLALAGGYLMGGIWLAVLFAAIAAIVLIVDPG